MKAVIKILKLLLVLLVIIILVNGFSAYTFKKYSSGNPADPEFTRGVYHLHSFYSDGLGSTNDIAIAARKRGLDFVILTDHGNPNINSVRSTGFSNGTLIIGASEFSLDSGHMTAAGFRTRSYRFPKEPQASIDEINSDKGITFIAHPFDSRIGWKNWDIRGFTGLEILSVYSCSKQMGLFSALSFPLEYIINHEYSILDTLYYPIKNFLKWDELNRKGRYLGIFALDAHAKLPVSKRITFKFPSYYAMFGVLNLYVKTGKLPKDDPKRASKIVIEKIRSGQYFNVIEGLSDANGFDTFFLPANNPSRIETGDYFPGDKGKLKIILPFNFRTDIVLFRNGKVIRRFRKNVKKEIFLHVDRPGDYRIEVFLSDSRFKKLPWIVTNPFFIGTKSPGEGKKDISPGLSRRLYLEKYPLVVEKNQASEGKTFLTGSGKIINLNYKAVMERSNEDFWIALAYRKKFDFSKFRSISFMTRSNKNMRYWLELRTNSGKEDIWFRHSFQSTKNWRKVTIPFEKMYCLNKKDKNIKIDLRKITSLFFSINNSILLESGVSGNLRLASFSLNK